MAEIAELRMLLLELKDFETDIREIDLAVKTAGYIETTIESLQDLYKQFHEAYVASTKTKEANKDQNVLAKIKVKYRTGNEIYRTCKGALRDSLVRLTPKPEILDHTQNPEATPIVIESIQTPPCDAPIFDGSYEAWPSFRDMFTAIYINNPRYRDDINKLFQLRRKLDKEPRAIVERFPLSNASFNLAWEALKSRYENKRMLVNSQLKHLFALPTLTNESPTELRRLVTTVNDCLSIFKTYDVDINGWDPILVFFCVQKVA